MNWDAIGAIAEALAAIGVIATLIYLGIQVRESKAATEANTRQMRGQAFVYLNEAVRHILSSLRENPSLLETVLKANKANWKDLSDNERRIASFWNLEEAAYHELAFMLWQEGALEEQSYVEREKYHITLLLEPGRRYWWDEVSFCIDPRFRARVNERLALAENSNHKKLDEQYKLSDS